MSDDLADGGPGILAEVASLYADVGRGRLSMSGACNARYLSAELMTSSVQVLVRLPSPVRYRAAVTAPSSWTMRCRLIRSIGLTEAARCPRRARGGCGGMRERTAARKGRSPPVDEAAALRLDGLSSTFIGVGGVGGPPSARLLGMMTVDALPPSFASSGGDRLVFDAAPSARPARAARVLRLRLGQRASVEGLGVRGRGPLHCWRARSSCSPGRSSRWRPLGLVAV